ncbi:hypothetical protein [Flavobacterium sp.]|uniref:hypothetical protein n=1 Tax=Flavobacterium sp. TaxID=239 RepID=UPI0026084E63|nr:hypothetical protein [Flavobacterium sp.]
MKKIAYIILISILFSCGREKPYPNKISDFRSELQIHLKKLASEKKLPSSDTIARNFIKENCTKEELLKLLNCEDPILRVIAYRTLVNKNDKDYFKILLGHLSDTTKVEWWYYEDAADNFMVSDLLIRKAVDSRKLRQTEKNILVDSVLLKHIYLPNSIGMMMDINPQEKYYSIIKNQSSKSSDECEKLAITFSLSKFKKENDVEYIKNNFKKFSENPNCNNYIFKSFEEFPNKEFFPILVNFFNEEIKKKKQFGHDALKYYCRAIAKYKSQESLELLTQILDRKNYPDTWYFKYNEEFVFKAIHKYNDPIYDNLYKKLKPKMSTFIMEYLDKPDYEERKTW